MLPPRDSKGLYSSCPHCQVLNYCQVRRSFVDPEKTVAHCGQCHESEYLPVAKCMTCRTKSAVAKDRTGQIDVCIHCEKTFVTKLAEKKVQLDHESVTKRVEADFAIVTGDGVKVKCHKVVLSMRSDVFLRMMDWKEGESGVLTLETEAKIVKPFVDFFYTQRIPDNLDPVLTQQLLEMADKYDVSELKELCEKRIMEVFNPKNCAKYLAWAHQYGFQEVKRFAMREILCNLSLLDTAAGLEMKESCPELWETLDMMRENFFIKIK